MIITDPKSSLSQPTPVVIKPLQDLQSLLLHQLQTRSHHHLGLTSFYARPYPNDKCGSNGLPLTPNSVRILGRFQALLNPQLLHPNLARYIDLQRSPVNPQRLFTVFEHHSFNLHHLLNDAYLYNLALTQSNLLHKWFYQLCLALDHLSRNHFVHRRLNLKYLLINKRAELILTGYGLFHMSEGGFCIETSLIELSSCPPECFLVEFLYANKFSACPANNTEQNGQLNDPKTDVWAFGAVMFQFLFGLSDQISKDLLRPERVIKYVLEFLTAHNKMVIKYKNFDLIF